MKYDVTLYHSDEGYAIWVPSLPGCWSQGATPQEALENIGSAIREYLDSDDGPPNAAVALAPVDPTACQGAEIREIEVAD